MRWRRVGLEAITRGELSRLIVNIPPRHMKSLAVTVFWPCWEWLTRPETRWLFASYAQGLSTRDSLKCRRLISRPSTSDPHVAASERTLVERIGPTAPATTPVALEADSCAPCANLLSTEYKSLDHNSVSRPAAVPASAR